MRKELLRKIRRKLAEKRRHKMWKRVVGALMAAAVFCTTYALILPAITLAMKTYCGVEEHTHDESCYMSLSFLCSPQDAADYVIHTHDEGCYDESGALVCGLDYTASAHTHSADCYDEEGKLSCSRLAVVAHQHSADCYDESGALVCTPGEGADYIVHSHDELCYDQAGSLICTLDEVGLHTHEESCYDEEGNLSCGKPRVIEHVHTDECRDTVTKKVIDCTVDEDADVVLHTHDSLCYDAEGNLICSLTERSEHTHDESCYTEDKTLVCDEVESEGHTHSEDCYSKVKGELICEDEDEDHEHSDDCYEWTKELDCGQEEGEGAHVHTDECYETSRELDCTKAEVTAHTHTDDCYLDGVLVCGQPYVIAHQHTEDCIETVSEPAEDTEPTKLLVCGKEEHTHSETCYEAPGDFSIEKEDKELGLSFKVTLPYDETLPKDLSFEIVELDEESEDYDPMIDSMEESVMDIIENDEDTEIDAHVYRLACSSEGEEYTLPKSAKVSVSVSESEDNAEISLLGYTLAREESEDGETVYSADRAKEDDGSLSMTLAGSLLNFAVIRTTAKAAEQAEESTGAGTSTSTVTGYYKLVTEMSDITDSDYYVIVTANGLYRLAEYKGRSSGGWYIGAVALQLNPIKGQDGCYQLQDVVCGEYITPNNHEDSNWKIQRDTSVSDQTLYKITKKSDTSSSDRLYVGQWGLSGRGTNWEDRLTLTYRSDEKVWWIGWPSGNYYISITGVPDAFTTTTTIDGHTLNNVTISDNEKSKVYDEVNITDDSDGKEGNRGLLIFRWVDSTLTVDNSELGAATLTGIPDESDEETYTYTDVSGAKSESVELGNIVENVSGTAASSQSTSNIEKIMGDKTTTGNATAYAEQAANDGRLITDKSIIYNADDYDAYESYETDEFSVTLSAQIQQWEKSHEEKSVPMDAVFILDLSVNEMNGDWRNTVTAVNAAMKTILESNSENRVGLVTYSDTAYQAMSLGNSGIYGTGGNYITYTNNSDYRTLTANGKSLNQTGMFEENFMQVGLESAYEMFKSEEVTENARQPVIILVSSGEPEIATYSYMNPSDGPFYGDGDSAAVFGFYSVLSAQYFKNMTGVHYGTRAAFYTIATTESLNSYQTAVLNPNETTIAALPEGTEQSDGSHVADSSDAVSANFKHLILSDKEGQGGSGGTYVGSTKTDSTIGNQYDGLGYTARYLRGVYNTYKDNTDIATGYYYCDGLFTADASSTDDLTAAFDSILDSVILENGYEYETSDITITDTLTSNFSVAEAPKLYIGGRVIATSSTTATDGGVDGTYSWSGEIDRVDMKGNAPDSKSYKKTPDTEVNLSGISAEVSENGTKIEWTIPANVVGALYPDLHGQYYYEESPVRLIYKVGLSDNAIEKLSLSVGTKTYEVSEKAATATFTYSDDNPYYSSSSYSGIKETDGLGYTEVRGEYTKKVTQRSSASGTLTLTRVSTMDVTITKDWDLLPDSEQPDSVYVNLYAAEYVEYVWTDEDGEILSGADLEETADYGRVFADIYEAYNGQTLSYILKDAVTDGSGLTYWCHDGDSAEPFTTVPSNYYNAEETRFFQIGDWYGVDDSYERFGNVGYVYSFEYMAKDGGYRADLLDLGGAAEYGGYSIELNSENNWTVQLEDLPTQNEGYSAGEELEYASSSPLVQVAIGITLEGGHEKLIYAYLYQVVSYKYFVTELYSDYSDEDYRVTYSLSNTENGNTNKTQLNLYEADLEELGLGRMSAPGSEAESYYWSSNLFGQTYNKWYVSNGYPGYSDIREDYFPYDWLTIGEYDSKWDEKMALYYVYKEDEEGNFDPDWEATEENKSASTTAALSLTKLMLAEITDSGEVTIENAEEETDVKVTKEWEDSKTEHEDVTVTIYKETKKTINVKVLDWISCDEATGEAAEKNMSNGDFETLVENYKSDPANYSWNYAWDSSTGDISGENDKEYAANYINTNYLQNTSLTLGKETSVSVEQVTTLTLNDESEWVGIVRDLAVRNSSWDLGYGLDQQVGHDSDDYNGYYCYKPDEEGNPVYDEYWAVTIDERYVYYAVETAVDGYTTTYSTPTYVYDTQAGVIGEEITSETVLEENQMAVAMLNEGETEGQRETTVTNSYSYTLPNSGGIGAGWYRLIGTLMVAFGAGVMMYRYRRKRE